MSLQWSEQNYQLEKTHRQCSNYSFFVRWFWRHLQQDRWICSPIWHHSWLPFVVVVVCWSESVHLSWCSGRWTCVRGKTALGWEFWKWIRLSCRCRWCRPFFGSCRSPCCCSIRRTSSERWGRLAANIGIQFQFRSGYRCIMHVWYMKLRHVIII